MDGERCMFGRIATVWRAVVVVVVCAKAQEGESESGPNFPKTTKKR